MAYALITQDVLTAESAVELALLPFFLPAGVAVV